MTTPNTTWRLIPGRDPESVFRAQVEDLGGGKFRPLVIEGRIRNAEKRRKGLPALSGMTNFDHRGHLIAHRLGGPDKPENLVPMHGRINMSGTPWYQMEEDVSRLIGKQAGQMKVVVQYADHTDPFRPWAFHVEVVNHLGVRYQKRFYNFNPAISR